MLEFSKVTISKQFVWEKLADQLVLNMVQYLLYVFATFCITHFLRRKGKFDDVRKTELVILTTIGFVLPWIDVVETWVGFKHEGNPFLTVFHTISPGNMWILFIVGHLGLSMFSVLCGLKGKSQEGVRWRFFLAFLDILMVIITMLNALFLFLYGFF